LPHFVELADQLIIKLASHNEYNQLPYGDREIKARIKLDLILKSMLCFAYECSGEGSQRYTAAAICACRRENNQETLAFLQSLAATWLSHLLFVYKWTCIVAKHALSTENSQDKWFPQIANERNSLGYMPPPTWEKTAAQMDVGASENREDKFKFRGKYDVDLIKHSILTIIQVLKRDGYRCVITNLPDENYPSLPPEEEDSMIGTIGCHRRVALSFGVQPQSEIIVKIAAADRSVC
jgi:hypothetical protein